MNRHGFQRADEPPRFRPGATGSARPNPSLHDEPPPDPPPNPGSLEELTRLSTTGSTQRRRRNPRLVPVPTQITIKPEAVGAIVAIVVVGLFLVGGVIVILQNWQAVAGAFVGIVVLLAIVGAAGSQS